MNTQSARAISSPIEFHSVTLADREIFEQAVTASDCRNCDMSFANIYCWQDTYHSQIAVWGGFLLIRFTLDGSTAYMQPIGSGNRVDVLEALAADAASRGEALRLFGLNEQWRECIEANFGDRFAISNLTANADYIYRSADLATLPGRKYQPKRNYINRFVSRYNYRFEPLDSSNIEQCRKLNRQWCEAKGIMCSVAEQRAIARALDNFSLLPLYGWILYVDSTPCAFAIGSAVNHDTFCIHFEKVDTTFDGAGAMINNLVATELAQHFTYINREDDLGIEGLRRAKQSYHPIELLAKYSALMLDHTAQQIVELWEAVFGDSRQTIYDFMVRHYDPALCFTHSEGNRTVAMVHLVPLQSENQHIAYIYAVATAESYRSQGTATSLIRSVLQAVDSGGYDYAALIPADSHSEQFYRKFGFESTGELFDFSEFDTDYDLGTGDSTKDFVMIRKNH